MKILAKILIFLLFITIFTLSPFAKVLASSLVFTKHPGNPTIPRGAPGSWEEFQTFDPNVMRDDDGTYKMYYLAWNNLYVIGIGLATSLDGITWTKYAGNPVLTGIPGSYDADLWEGEVKKENGIYKMWYQGSGDGQTTYQTHYATSLDGITWTRYSSNPILTGGLGKWDQDYVGIRSVQKVGNTYHGWYEASKLVGGSFNKFNVGYARSLDGINWTKISVDEPVLKGDAGQWDDVNLVSSTVRSGNIFVTFYSGRTVNASLGIALSADGEHWTKYPTNPVYNLLGASGSWDDDLSTTIISSILDSTDPPTFKLYYRGNNGSYHQSGGITLVADVPITPTTLTQYKSNGTTIIQDGGVTDERSVILKFNMSSNLDNDLLIPQVEVRKINDNFTGEVTHSGTALAYSGSPVVGSVTVAGLDSCSNYHWRAYTSNLGGYKINNGGTFSTGNCGGSVLNIIYPELLPNWFNFKIDESNPNNVLLNFNIRNADQIAISPQEVFSSTVSWQPLTDNLSYYFTNRNIDNNLFVKFRSLSGGETKIQNITIPRLENKTQSDGTISKSQTPKTVLKEFIFKRTLSLGSKGEDVKYLQDILKKLKFLAADISSTGYYGSLTQKAVSQLQKYFDKLPYNKIYNLKPYPGVVGKNTLRFLNEVLSNNN